MESDSLRRNYPGRFRGYGLSRGIRPQHPCHSLRIEAGLPWEKGEGRVRGSGRRESPSESNRFGICWAARKTVRRNRRASETESGRSPAFGPLPKPAARSGCRQDAENRSSPSKPSEPPTSVPDVGGVPELLSGFHCQPLLLQGQPEGVHCGPVHPPAGSPAVLGGGEVLIRTERVHRGHGPHPRPDPGHPVSHADVPCGDDYPHLPRLRVHGDHGECVIKKKIDVGEVGDPGGPRPGSPERRRCGVTRPGAPVHRNGRHQGEIQ